MSQDKSDIHIRIPGSLDERLNNIKAETGLNKSEIARRGILDQIRELEGGRIEE